MKTHVRFRRAAAILLAAALLVSCSPETVPDPAATGEPGEPGSGADPGAPSPSAANDPPPGADGGGGDGGGTDASVSVPSDTASLGAMCRHYLRAEPARLVIEVDWQPGAEAAPSSVDHLRGVLSGVADKPQGVGLAGHDEVPGGDPDKVWTAADLRAVANDHRSQFSSPEQVAMYVLFVRGRFEQEGVIGVAHSATEMAIFPDQIRGLSTDLLGGRGALERAVLVHEAGHLLCLVNIGYTSALDREDPEHPHHSSDRASVMHWAIDTSAVGQLFNGPPPDDFTAQDREDLEGLRSGRY